MPHRRFVPEEIPNPRADRRKGGTHSPNQRCRSLCIRPVSAHAARDLSRYGSLPGFVLECEFQDFPLHARRRQKVRELEHRRSTITPSVKSSTLRAVAQEGREYSLQLYEREQVSGLLWLIASATRLGRGMIAFGASLELRELAAEDSADPQWAYPFCYVARHPEW
jgi:hypothetical protein